MPLPGLGNITHRRSISKGTGNSIDEGRPPSSGGEGGDETVVEPEQGNVLSHIISQLRPGADLSRVTLPTFILEPRSMLERITNFMAHPEFLLQIPAIDDPVGRFVAVVKFYMSGWHIKPPGVKKPLNPILGETFTGYWDYEDGTQGYYISEQTSHHPPKSSYYFAVPKHDIRVDGTLKPRSKFLGNSVGSFMEGVAILRFTNRTTKTKNGERYFLTQPNMYARGILFGKMKYELGDHSSVTCPENNLAADIEFKTKGWVGGTYNAIGGVIKNTKTGEVLYELSGMWNGEMSIKDHATGKKDVMFDATHAKHSPPKTRPLEEQSDRESQKLWHKTNVAIKEANHTVATDEKTAIEEAQRAEAAQRHEKGEEWHPKLFRPVHGGPGGSEEGEENLDFILKAPVDGKNPDEIIEQILAIAPILPSQVSKAPSQGATTVAGPAKPSVAEQSAQKTESTQNPQAAPATSVPQRTAAPQEAKEGNLIDFGNDNTQHSDNHITPTPTPAQVQAQAQAPTQAPPAQNLAPPKVQELRPSSPVIRHDSVSNQVEEFVDAEG